jgi:2-dehydro-3-deoxygalactonokinase
MGWAEGFIAVDWGTTNRRAWRVGGDGRVAAELDDDRGALAVPQDGFPQAVAEIRARLGDLPLLMAGMVGSNRGWVEVPYVACPVGLPELAGQVAWPEPGRVAMVPGVSSAAAGDADVMRGEEVQILGAFAEGQVPPDGFVCHPGTHNKWVRLEDGRIAAFRTVMTGELFSLLKEHSILADLLAGEVEPDAAFIAGVRHGLDRDDLLAELFAARARVLLGKAPSAQAACYVSGLLIGNDLRIGLAFAGEGHVLAMGRPELTRLYATALAEAGRSCRELDGEAAFLAGARRLVELIR